MITALTQKWSELTKTRLNSFMFEHCKHTNKTKIKPPGDIQFIQDMTKSCTQKQLNAQ